MGRSRSALAVVALCLSCAGPTQQTGRGAAQLLIRGVTVIDGTGADAKGPVDVLVRDGRIALVSSTPLQSEGAAVIDGDGRFLVPGLTDAHTHPFPIEQSFPQFLRYGVTSILVTGCSDCDDATLTRTREATMRPGAEAPRFFHTSQHFSMEGRHPSKTYQSPKWRDGVTIHYLESVEEIGPLVERVTRLPIVGIKLTIEEGPAPPFVERIPQRFVDEVVVQAHAHGTKVFAHVSDIEELRMAQSAGVDHLLHFTGVDIDWQKDLPVVEDLLARDVHWVTTLMIDKSLLYPLRPDWIAALREEGVFDAELDRLAASAPDASEHRGFLEMLYGSENPSFESSPVLRKQFEDLRRLHDMGFRLVVGTDIGNRYIFPGHSLHEEMELLEQGGFNASEILVMATRNAAELLGAADELGTLEVGKRADMLLLRADPRESVKNLRAIESVFRDGQVVRNVR